MVSQSQIKFAELLNRPFFEQYIQYNLGLYNFVYFETCDILDLVTSCLYIYKAYLIQNPLLFMQPTCHNDIHKYILSILDFQFGEFTQIDTISKLDKTQEINNIINIAFALIYKYITPKRSGCYTVIKKINIEKTNDKIIFLKNIVQPAQRTPEWYEFRHNTLTASNLWKVFSSDAGRNQLIYEKCQPINEDKFKSLSTTSPMHWGQKYEPLSIMYYENTYNTQVSDFGCIQHRDYPFIAASPDGINTRLDSPLFGRMLEIKNTVSREITGNPKLDYWVQTQIQMETCNLNKCDFLETKFAEYENEEAFLADTASLGFAYTRDGKLKGVIIYFVKDAKPFYEYMPLRLTVEESVVWTDLIMEKHKDLLWVETIYWRLEIVSCVLILRNKQWFNAALPHIETLWNIICKEKNGDYQHRAPKKRQKKVVGDSLLVVKNGSCIIDIDV